MKHLLTRYYFACIAVLGAGGITLSFILGREEGSLRQRTAVTLSCSDTVLKTLTIPVAQLADPDAATPIPAKTGAFVGSKNGTKYYAPTCSALKRIKPENYRWFSDAESAKLQGYTPGKC